MIDRFHARCLRCPQDFFSTRHIASHNLKFPDHEVQVLNHGSYDPKTGFKRTEYVFEGNPISRAVKDLN